MRRLTTMATALACSLVTAACGPSRDDASTANSTRAQPSGFKASLPVSTRPAAIARSETRHFQDWYAVCDNGNRCVAYSGTDATAWIRVESEAGGSTDRGCVGFGMGQTGQDDTASPVVLSADGRSLLRMQGGDGRYCADGLAGPPQDALALAADARRLTLAAAGQTQSVPAAGLKAALLWIDERQGRLDNETALVRRGPRLGRLVPPAPELPRIVPAPAVSQASLFPTTGPANAAARGPKASAALEALPVVRQCRDDTAFSPDLQKAVTAARLDAKTELWGVPCDSGAYNVIYRYFLTGPGGSAPHEAVFPEADGIVRVHSEGDPAGLFNPAYDPATRVLTAFAKARGIGDCGTLQSWTWTGRGFVMSREQVMGECWGMTPHLWPTTWRSR